MERYQKAYAYLVGQVDEALTILDSDNLLEVGKAKNILQNVLYEMEELMISADEKG